MKKSLLLACLVLVGCGGGGAMQPVAPIPPAAAPGNPPPVPDPIKTQEFLTSPVLAHINADAAYREGITGVGVVVGILEDGIDDEHPELIDRIHPLSRAFGGDITRGIKSTGEHGTRTGGIIAAEKNDVGTHGVAYDAQLLVLSVEDDSDCFLDPYGVPKCTSFFEAIPEAIDFAVAQGVKIIMVQRGGGDQAAIDAAGLTVEFESIAAAYDRAINAGVVFISPAGNGDVNDPLTASPTYFPNLAVGLIAGHENGLIVVGSVDADNNLWVWQNSASGMSQSHAAGDAAEFFLVAPSVAPYVKKDGTLTTKFRPGTSNSAPHVAGAAALLQQAFPNLTGREIAEILFESATDLGAPGTDPIFGRGLLNIEAALQPLGTATVATASGNIAPLAQTVARISPAFGDVFRGAAQLRQVMMLDKYDRSFIFDLGGQVYEPGRRGVNYEGLLGSQNAFQSFDVQLGEGGSLGFSFYNPNHLTSSADQFLSGPTQDKNTSVQPLLIYSTQWNTNTSVGLSLGASASQLLDRNSSLASYSSVFARTDAFGSQRTSFSGDVLGGLVSRQISGNAELSLGMTVANYDTNPTAGRKLYVSPQKHFSYEGLASFAYSKDRATFRINGGVVREEETVLGSKSSGALKLGDGSTTLFGAVEATYDLGQGRIFFGLVQQGFTNVDGTNGSFVTGVGGFRTSAFAVGLFDRSVFGRNDRLGVSVSQPLRVENGNINLSLPTSRNYAEDRLLYSDSVLSLSPSGREIDLELSYSGLARGFGFNASFMITRQQGHSRSNGIGTNLIVRGFMLF